MGASDNYLLTNDYLHPESTLGQTFHTHLRQYAHTGLVTNKYLEKLVEMQNTDHPWMSSAESKGNASANAVLDTLTKRLTTDAYSPTIAHLADSIGSHRLIEQIQNEMDHVNTYVSNVHKGHFQESLGKSIYMGVIDANGEKKTMKLKKTSQKKKLLAEKLIQKLY